MDFVYYVTGYLVWLAIYGILLWLAGEIIWGFVLTCSWVRWVMARSSRHEESLNWSKFPRSFLHMWGQLIGHRKGKIEFFGPTGYWRGLGDWAIATPPQTDKGD